jgi:hypothetical protein
MRRLAQAAILAAAVATAAGCTGRGGKNDGDAAATSAAATAPASGAAVAAAALSGSGKATAAPPASAAAAAEPGVPPRACVPLGAEGSPAQGTAAMFASPRTPVAGAPLRVALVSEHAIAGALVVVDPDGVEVARAEMRGGPPFWWMAAVPAARAGAWRVHLEGPAGRAECVSVAVAAEPSPPDRRGRSVWPVTRDWERGAEGLYAAWIEKLFDDPLDVQPSWPALHEVLRDPKRNFLHSHMGEGEDAPGERAFVFDPDCADLPFFLRGYFAFKLGLPFGYSGCTRGGPGGPPRCVRWHNNLEARMRGRGTGRTASAAFAHFLRVNVADTVHSGSGRTPAAADDTDFYPVPLTRESLRPGTIYADPYGHMLVVVRRIPQTAESGGVLLAVDGQPDATVARRRFWRGNFLFEDDPVLGSPGFKRFRPVVREGARLRPLDNDEIARAPAYGDFALDQYQLGKEGFYDRMDDVLSPAPLDPSRAMREAIQALEEQVRGRVQSVQNGADWQNKNGEVADMPEGASIFETTGPWEDFSTPSRDLRLLIAIDIVRGFPERVARRPQRYAIAAGRDAAALRASLDAELATELTARKVEYKRSDGSPFTLTLSDVVARAKGLEMAYNPNDCVETRWAAPAKSPEASTCRRWAPGDQRARMGRYRSWFADRKRPPRGG